MMAPTDVRRGTIITGSILRSWDACGDQCATVEQLWPDGVAVTLDALTVAQEAHLDLDWFACAILTAPAWQEYERVRATALQEYERVWAPAWQEYERVRATALWALIAEVRP